MATKPKDIDWGRLNVLKNELVDWLEARGLADAEDDELTLAFKLLEQPKRHGRVVFAVARALYEIERFRAASQRSACENIVPRNAKLTEKERTLLALMMDDSVERAADRAIRALTRQPSYIEGLVQSVADRHVQRANAMRFDADRERIERGQARVRMLLRGLRQNIRDLHGAFLALSPSMRREALSLAGANRFEKRLRLALVEAGYSGK